MLRFNMFSTIQNQEGGIINERSTQLDEYLLVWGVFLIVVFASMLACGVPVVIAYLNGPKISLSIVLTYFVFVGVIGIVAVVFLTSSYFRYRREEDIVNREDAENEGLLDDY